MDNMKIILTGGGTGGHIFPLISVIREIKKDNPNVDVFYLGPKDDFAKTAFESEKIPVFLIPSGKIRRYFNIKSIIQNFHDIFINIPLGFFKSLGLIKKIKPDLIFSKGGYGSIPIILAGSFMGIPIYLHESDSVAGITNKIAAFFAKKIFVSFPADKVKNLPIQKLVFTGNPIRKTLISGNLEKAKEYFSLECSKPILLVLGGSQGSTRVNTIILENLDYLLEKFEIIHQTGRVDYNRIIGLQKAGYHIYDFLSEEAMANALFCCSLVISRSGSGSISEISANGKPSILIPLPESAQNHQAYNATIYEQSGACIVISEKELTQKLLFDSIEKIMDPSSNASYCKSAKGFSNVDSAKKITEEILKQ